MESFSLICGNDADSYTFSGATLSTLSRNLKKLDLRRSKALQAFGQLMALNERHFDHLETLHLKILHRGMVAKHQLIDFALPNFDGL